MFVYIIIYVLILLSQKINKETFIFFSFFSIFSVFWEFFNNYIFIIFVRTNFIVDFVSVFPFKLLMPGNSTALKLFRCLRLPRFLKLLNEQRITELLEKVFSSSSIEDKMTCLYISKFLYKVRFSNFRSLIYHVLRYSDFSF